MIRFFFKSKMWQSGEKSAALTQKKKKKTGSIASLVCTYDFIVGVSQ